MIQQRFLSFGQEKRYKYVLVGDSNVGKTTLFWRYIEGEFLERRQTQVTTVDFKIKNTTLKGKPIKLYIWDTAGQQKYRSIVSTYFKGCHGIILVFDVNNANSFENVTKQWYELCKSKAEEATIILVGNKTDLKNEVPEQQIREWANSKKISYLLTSVKMGTNVEQVFMNLTKMVNDKQQPQKSQSFMLGQGKKPEKKKCC